MAWSWMKCGCAYFFGPAWIPHNSWPLASHSEKPRLPFKSTDSRSSELKGVNTKQLVSPAWSYPLHSGTRRMGPTRALLRGHQEPGGWGGPPVGRCHGSSACRHVPGHPLVLLLCWNVIAEHLSWREGCCYNLRGGVQCWKPLSKDLEEPHVGLSCLSPAIGGRHIFYIYNIFLLKLHFIMSYLDGSANPVS